MRYISLFSGIEAASVAWCDLGFVPVAFCEIDKFPSAVLDYRFPDVPNLGDITKVDWKEVIDNHGAVDIIVGGSPCQSFSIAGGRESLDGESRLMFEYIRAIQDVRPKWLLWENVPGVLSTRDNAFGQLQEELEKLGYGLAWRVLDAQFFGVAQRRKRVFLVGCIGSIGASAAVLFNKESVSGNTQTSKQKRQGFSGAAANGDEQGCWVLASDNGGAAVDYDMVGTLCANSGLPPIVAVPKCYALKVRGGKDTYIKRDGTIGTAGKGALVSDDLAFTIAASQDQVIVENINGVDWIVRKLMPIECERLQGFPDDWTRVPYRGKGVDDCPDGPRYKALGNSMAVPVMRWIGERMQIVEKISE